MTAIGWFRQRRGKAAPSALAVTLLLASAAGAQVTRTVVFRALDKVTGAPFPDLRAGDVEILEGNTTLAVSTLRFGASPMDLVLALDTGPATFMTSRVITIGARLACLELEGGDRLALVTFSSGHRLRFPFVSGGRELGLRIERAFGGPASSRDVRVFDGVMAALGLFPAGVDSSRTRAVLIVSNSVDKGSTARPETILAAAGERHAALFAISAPVLWVSEKSLSLSSAAGVPSERFTKDAGLAAGQLRRIAEESGGEAQVLLVNGFTLRQTLERIRFRYVATYTLTSEPRHPPAIRLSPEAAARLPNLLLRGAW